MVCINLYKKAGHPRRGWTGWEATSVVCCYVIATTANENVPSGLVGVPEPKKLYLQTCAHLPQVHVCLMRRLALRRKSRGK